MAQSSYLDSKAAGRKKCPTYGYYAGSVTGSGIRHCIRGVQKKDAIVHTFHCFGKHLPRDGHASLLNNRQISPYKLQRLRSSGIVICYDGGTRPAGGGGRPVVASDRLHGIRGGPWLCGERGVRGVAEREGRRGQRVQRGQYRMSWTHGGQVNGGNVVFVSPGGHGRVLAPEGDM